MRKIPEKHKTTVGASLLAKASGQATAMLNVAPPSRAGSLPQGICVGSGNCEPARDGMGSGNNYLECSNQALQRNDHPPHLSKLIPAHR
ncbi:hypothetical protein RS3R1_19460 [Pseudomonas atacamensis]|uniref:Uncharacterized protein n=1 Tax=Pseudomonas atacamensis TaxID=2565368 RepID=A0ABQ5PH78_9PSED|nr:hypothetical protein RS3R1_19460 [Pseudomonas atacamensis]